MPTLASIRVHPEVRRVLCEVADPPITTPQALLSRDPSHLRAVLQVPTLAPIHELRGAVADALISTTHYGKRALYVCASNHNDTNNEPLIVGATTALDLLQYQQSKKCRLNNNDDESSGISTGCQSLDTLLSSHNTGGLQFGCVTQLTGPPGSCKTQLCLWLSKMHAQNNNQVYYLASSFGGHNQNSLTRRLTQFLNESNYETILTNIHIRNVSNSSQELLLELQRLMVVNDESALIILDSASGCLSSDLYNNHQNSDTTVQQVATTLRTLARHYGMAVLITNGTVSGDNGTTTKPAMGQKWNVADVHLWLEEEAAVNNQVVTQEEPLVVSQRKIVRATLLEDRMGEAHRGGEAVTTVAQFAVTAQGISNVGNE